jgi:thiosulfate reductase cytochrome b subunit
MGAGAIFLAGVDDRRFHWARLWHFLIIWALLAFVFGHLVMVVLRGWNFVCMSTGWKKDPEYVAT